MEYILLFFVASLLFLLKWQRAAPHFPITQGPLPRFAPHRFVFWEGKAMFCASWSVILHHVPGLMHGPSFLLMNFGELREASNFTILGCLMVTVDKTSSSKWHFTFWVQPRLKMAFPIPSSHYTSSIQMVWFSFFPEVLCLREKNISLITRGPKSTIFCLCRVSLEKKKINLSSLAKRYRKKVLKSFTQKFWKVASYYLELPTYSLVLGFTTSYTNFH